VELDDEFRRRSVVRDSRDIADVIESLEAGSESWMLFEVRKLVAMSLAVLMTIAPVASEAAPFQYFRMFGGGQGGDVVSPPPPTGTLSYSVAGPSTATVGVPYSASASVAGAVGAATFSVFSGAFPPGLTLNSSSGAIQVHEAAAAAELAVLADERHQVRDAAEDDGRLRLRDPWPRFPGGCGN
jgi:hypothetical protein